ncbi:interleukin-31 receptor subunit alpha [Paramisgurnus dabryanus]|uniref:interleukin-31 receptor subunit alpha n=1 Tax=Paramisgurnus dabryanus TaxID=90735 RepID=UPI0031F459C1
MSRIGVVCLLISVCCCDLKRNTQRLNTRELTLNNIDLKHCEKQKNVCVMSASDCLDTASDGKPEGLSRSDWNFVNTSCHFLMDEESLTCSWIQLNDIKTINTFIISREKDIIHCPAILNDHSSFYLTIKSVNLIDQREIFSDVYKVNLSEIIQAPQPVIRFVKSTDTSLNVTWTSGVPKITQCRIRLSTASWTEMFPVSDVSKESLYIINNLQPYTEYSLSVSCSHGYGQWSKWSSEARAMTSESVPIAAPLVSYYLNSVTQQLGILWKALDRSDARGLIQGYEVSYAPSKHLARRQTIHTSDLKIVVSVMSEEYDITVSAYNSAGRSPSRRLRVNAALHHDVPAVKGLWVSSDGLFLKLHWEVDVTAVNVSEFAIEWRSSSDLSSSGWMRVSASTFTALLPDIKSGLTYSISVYPVHEDLCGAPVSVFADLQHGTLLDLLGFHLISLTKSSLTVRFVWKETQPNINVLHYKLVLQGKHQTQYITHVFPHKAQELFNDLQANAKYTLYIHGETVSGNFSKATLDVTTPLLDYDEIIKCCVPLVLLLLGFGFFSVLTKTVCKQYFFPNVANPGYSLIGHWLLNASFENNSKICVLRLENVFTVEQQTEKSIIHVERRTSSVAEDEVISSKICTTSEGTTHRSRSDYVENSPGPLNPPDYIDLPVFTSKLDYVYNEEIICESVRRPLSEP